MHMYGNPTYFGESETPHMQEISEIGREMGIEDILT